MIFFLSVQYKATSSPPLLLILILLCPPLFPLLYQIGTKSFFGLFQQKNFFCIVFVLFFYLNFFFSPYTPYHRFDEQYLQHSYIGHQLCVDTLLPLLVFSLHFFLGCDHLSFEVHNSQFTVQGSYPIHKQ